MRSFFDSVSEGISIGVASMCSAFIVAGLVNAILEPARDELAAKQELAGLMDPATYKIAVTYFLEEIQ